MLAMRVNSGTLATGSSGLGSAFLLVAQLPAYPDRLPILEPTTLRVWANNGHLRLGLEVAILGMAWPDEGI
jgi:hypothetical protein